jgi:hypothetical protein
MSRGDAQNLARIRAAQRNLAELWNNLAELYPEISLPPTINISFMGHKKNCHPKL